MKTKRERFSDSRPDSSAQLPSIVKPTSPLLVPRNSSSSSSWGVAELSDSDGDYDWGSYTTSNAPISSATQVASRSLPNGLQNSPELGKDDLAAFARPAKRAHLESQEDRQTYGQFAGLQIRPTSFDFGSSANRPTADRANSGVTGTFGLGSPFSPLGASAAPPVPPSSPIKSSAQSSTSVAHASPSFIYQQAVASADASAPPPPTSPVNELPNFHSLGETLTEHMVPSKRRISVDLEDSDMRIRKAPSSYEVEPNRVIVVSLDDTSSSASDAEADTSADSKDSANATSGYVINHELIEKLEAHRRAVLTGTSDRDNNAAASSSNSSSSRSKRSGGRRSGGGTSTGSGLSQFASLLNSKRRSAQSSASSSGFASPSDNGTQDDVHGRGALILWKDPEQILKPSSVSAPSSSSPLKPLQQQDAARLQQAFSPSAASAVPSLSATSSALDGLSSLPPSDFSSGGLSDRTQPTTHPIESPLYAQQSSLSSSYFPSTSSFHKQMQAREAAPTSAWPSFDTSSPSQYQAQHSFSQPQQHQTHPFQHPVSSPIQQFGSLHHGSPPHPSTTSVSDEMDLDG